MTSEARFIRADRLQTRWDFIDLEALLASDHRVRIVMSFVESLDLSGLYEAIKAREGEPGRPPPDPAVVLASWLYAAIEGVGSARQLERLAQRDLAYRWIAGGAALNHRGLADFRVAHGDGLDRLPSESVSAPMADDIVRRHDKTPENLLVDTHYATCEDIAAPAEHAAGPLRVFAPTPSERDDVGPRTLAERQRRRARQPASVQEWRSRMATQAGQEVFSLRKLIERINANLKNHGFGFLPVRGLSKAKAMALRHALANNLMAAHRLRIKTA